MVRWIGATVENRLIEMADNEARLSVHPGGGSPVALLWLLVVENLFLEINSHGIYKVYTDDVRVIETYCFQDTVSEILQAVLRWVERWFVGEWT